MRTRSAELPLTEVSGAEAVRLLDGSTPVRPAHVQRGMAAAPPVRHVGEFVRRIVRTLTPTPPEPLSLSAADNRWTVTAVGPADVFTDLGEAAHYRCTPPGRVHGPHDPVVRIRPQSATGYRCARPTEG
ncbi:hypothetical protein [Streptomyces sp. LUP47B]|uniref:hypothetical protein n=1 Tax=Streptomyces sp. LUP47B TaxID=1890286 RepID=UPI000851B705|nr:hypothetical protein [Streptomyces sp. LUP47B]